jgi:hypothetical protein
MKTKIALGAIAMSIASFSLSANAGNPAAEQAGKKIFTAFQQSAFTEYTSLVPTLQQLQQVMDQHASFYGPYLQDAKAELSRQYEKDLNGIESSFIRAIEEGRLHHIAWTKATFISAERERDKLVIAFNVNGNMHKMQIVVTEIDGELRPGKFISFI